MGIVTATCPVAMVARPDVSLHDAVTRWEHPKGATTATLENISTTGDDALMVADCVTAPEIAGVTAAALMQGTCARVSEHVTSPCPATRSLNGARAAPGSSVCTVDSFMNVANKSIGTVSSTSSLELPAAVLTTTESRGYPGSELESSEGS